MSNRYVVNVTITKVSSPTPEKKDRYGTVETPASYGGEEMQFSCTTTGSPRSTAINKAIAAMEIEKGNGNE